MNHDYDEKNDLIFSLDIGTRTIIGLICKENKKGQLEILEYAIREHEQRNMYDGQIHDILGVAKVVEEVKSELEDKIGKEIKTVSVAAAGRALITEKSMAELEINKDNKIQENDVSTLEIKALQIAQRNISKRDSTLFEYYNIGYSVIEYYLDGIPISNLRGHRGNNIGVEVLATFLPKVVIEGLYSVIEEVGLKISSITLEPIAAINVSIKKDLRILNLALVDIGAGTSDIAITKEGQIIYYGMTQTAGDEITEALVREYLIDFKTAEKLKKEIFNKDKHRIKNILGMEKELNSDEIIDKLEEPLEKVSKDIAREIIEYNGKKPDAIFLIGGSSQMPTLKEKIAENIGIPKDRISIKDLSEIELVKNHELLNRPDMVTPLGIAYEALENKHRNFLNVKFNGEEIQLFNTGNIKVSDILVLKKFEPKKLLPKKGKKLVYYKNGNKRIIKDKEGTRPQILVNEEVSDLQRILETDDEIKVIESVLEDSDPIRIKDVISKDTDINEIKVNEQKVDINYILKENDNLKILKKETKNSDLGSKKRIKGKLNQDLNQISLNVNDDIKNIEYKKEPFRFIDIFDYIDFDRTEAKGKLCLLVNDKKAEYLQKLKDGDKIEIYWE